MIKYYLIWQGPINKDWIDKNGGDWCAGRIDVQEYADLPMYTDEQLDNMTEDEYFSLFKLSPCGTEIAVPVMSTYSWNKFREWLRTVETDDVWTLEQLTTQFEKTNLKIEWFAQERNDEVLDRSR